jgi:hypothetical protein
MRRGQIAANIAKLHAESHPALLIELIELTPRPRLARATISIPHVPAHTGGDPKFVCVGRKR